jgi:hypothetical protein
VLTYFRANGYKAIHSHGRRARRVYSDRVYGIPRQQVIGTAGGVKYGYDKDASRS